MAVWAYALARLPELLPRNAPAPLLVAPSPQPRVDAAALQFGEQLVRILVGVVIALFLPAACCVLCAKKETFTFVRPAAALQRPQLLRPPGPPPPPPHLRSAPAPLHLTHHALFFFSQEEGVEPSPQPPPPRPQPPRAPNAQAGAGKEGGSAPLGRPPIEITHVKPRSA